MKIINKAPLRIVVFQQPHDPVEDYEHDGEGGDDVVANIVTGS